MELQALTIVLLGGVAFAGGRGKMFGVFTAWVFLGVLDNGLTLLNVPPFVQLVASGLALVFAASLDALGPISARGSNSGVASPRRSRKLKAERTARHRSSSAFA